MHIPKRTGGGGKQKSKTACASACSCLPDVSSLLDKRGRLTGVPSCKRNAWEGIVSTVGKRWAIGRRSGYKVTLVSESYLLLFPVCQCCSGPLACHLIATLWHLFL